MKLQDMRTIAILTACVTLNTGCMMAVRTVAQSRQPDLARLFDSADTNGDGVITRVEFRSACERGFAALDRNGDGYIDRSDMSSRLAARQKAQDRLARMTARLDKDGDNRISRAEFVDGLAPLFDLADTDHNGELSKEEMATARVRWDALRS